MTAPPQQEAERSGLGGRAAPARNTGAVCARVSRDPQAAAHVAPEAKLCVQGAPQAPQLARAGQSVGQTALLRGIAEKLSDAARMIAELAGTPLEDASEPRLMEPMATEPMATIEGTSLADIRNDYLGDLAQRVSERHLAGTKARLARVIEALGATPAEDLRPLDVVRFQNGLRASGLSERTCDTYVGALKAMLNWAVEMGILDGNPIARIKRLATKSVTPRCRRRALSDEEIERFLRASREDDYEQQFNARASAEGRIPQTALWQTLLLTGGRWNEIRQLTWGDLDLDGRRLVLRAENTKSKKSRPIPLRDELVLELRQLYDDHIDYLGRAPEPGDRVFLTPEGKPWPRPTTNAGRIFHRILKAAGIDRRDAEGRRIDIHALRHTFGSKLARRGVSLVKTQRLMGHSDPKLTEAVYTHLGVEDLRDAVEVLG